MVRHGAEEQSLALPHLVEHAPSIQQIEDGRGGFSVLRPPRVDHHKDVLVRDTTDVGVVCKEVLQELARARARRGRARDQGLTLAT